jgi:uncharacterized protein (DUF2336 family)
LSDVTGLESIAVDEVLMRGGADARKELARQLAERLADGDLASSQREICVANLIKLATDPVMEVRQSVAQHLSLTAPLEPDLLFTIIADEEEIALPFLAGSPALDLPMMLAVLKAGDELRQIQVAARQDLFHECAHHIVTQGGWPACAALLDNPEFEPSESDYRMIYRRFSGEPKIVDRLMAKHDIPLDIRILQAKQASNRIQSYLYSAALVKTDPSDFIADAEESATLQVLAQAHEFELDQAVRFLLDKGMLTPSLILRAAVVGEMRVVDRALALLSGIPLKRVQGMLYQRSSHSNRAIFNRCGLAKHCTHVIQAAIAAEREIRAMGDEASSDAFGTRVVEIITCFDRLSVDEKLKLLTHVENLGTERPRAMAAKIKLSLARSGMIAA